MIRVGWKSVAAVGEEEKAVDCCVGKVNRVKSMQIELVKELA